MARNEYYMTEKLKVLDLFSGLGGFSLGLERTGHFETVAFCDNDKYSKLIIDKHWKGKKVYEDVREITKEKLIADGIELPDVITGGFPCQPFSVAGKQKGTSDDRHLWPEMFRIIKALKPRIVVGENVRGIVNIQDGMVFETVCTNLEDEGYEVQAFNIPAAGVGAPHRRERIWIIATLGDPKYDGPLTDEIGRRNEEINGGTEKRQNNSFEFERTSGREDNENLSINVANANDEGLRTRIGGSDDDHAKESRSRGTDGRRSTSDDERHNTTSTTDGKMDVANTTSKGLERQFGSKLQGTRERFTHGSQTINRDVADTNSQRQQEQCRSKSVSKERDELERSSGEERSGWWEVEPNVGRVAHGVRGRVHRLKGLGNSIVPQIVEEIGKALIKGMK
jgi:DNA (cytosine-5)-methyltransferase 1